MQRTAEQTRKKRRLKYINKETHRCDGKDQETAGFQNKTNTIK